MNSNASWVRAFRSTTNDRRVLLPPLHDSESLLVHLHQIARRSIRFDFGRVRAKALIPQHLQVLHIRNLVRRVGVTSAGPVDEVTVLDALVQALQRLLLLESGRRLLPVTLH